MTASRKAPCIDVRTDVHKDERFKALAELAGHANYCESLGRMHALWSWCRDRGLKDTCEGFDGYIVSEAIVRRFLGPSGVTAILAVFDGEAVDDLALAARLDDGMLYLRGTSDYVAAARAHQTTSKAGGEARARQAAEQGARNSSGRYVSEPTNVQPEPSRTPADSPPDNQPEPASYLLPLTSSQDQKTHTRARERHPEAGRIALAAWKLGQQLRIELVKANVAGVPQWPLTNDGEHTGWVALLDRVGELLVESTASQAEAVVINRVRVAFAKAKHDGEGHWFACTSMFTKNSFDTWAHHDPESFVRKPARSGGRETPVEIANRIAREKGFV